MSYYYVVNSDYLTNSSLILRNGLKLISHNLGPQSISDGYELQSASSWSLAKLNFKNTSISIV